MRITRAGDLLRSLLADDAYTRELVSAELCITPAECDEFVAGTKPMSPAHQLCLAALVIERVPRLARRGYSLRSQVLAAAAFAQGITEVHSSPQKWTDNRLSRRHR